MLQNFGTVALSLALCQLDYILLFFNSNFVLNPPGLASVLQPLNIYINKIFKANVKKEYHKWLLKNNTDVINDYNLLDFIYNTCYNIDQHNQENIIEKSFIDNGITLKTDGWEDSEF